MRMRVIVSVLVAAVVLASSAVIVQSADLLKSEPPAKSLVDTFPRQNHAVINARRCRNEIYLPTSPSPFSTDGKGVPQERYFKLHQFWPPTEVSILWPLHTLTDTEAHPAPLGRSRSFLSPRA
jgi:hypothetical protein